MINSASCNKEAELFHVKHKKMNFGFTGLGIDEKRILNLGKIKTLKKT